MKTTKCNQCGFEIGMKTAKCVNCGEPIGVNIAGEGGLMRKVIYILIIVSIARTVIKFFSE